MKLFTSAGACSLADHIALHWAGAPFEVQVVSRAEKKQPEFLALNPSGAVPVLTFGAEYEQALDAAPACASSSAAPLPARRSERRWSRPADYGQASCGLLRTREDDQG